LKIVVLASRFPFPIEKGDKLRMYHQLKDLSKNNELHLISLSQESVSDNSRKQIAHLCKSHNVLKISKIHSFALAMRGIFNNLPFQVNYFHSKAKKKDIHRIITKISPDVIYCQLIRMSEYVVDLPYPKIIDFMDAFSLNYSRRVKFENPLAKLFFTAEAKRLSTYEKEMNERFDASVIIADTDRNHIDKDNRIEKVTNGLDTAYFKAKSILKSHDIVFVGNMGYHPNILAAQYLVERILPKLESKVKIKIAGARPSNLVTGLSSDTVTVTGWVDDIRNAYASSKIFVAPIFTGAGQQNKIMEAMAMEMICITTPIVNEGIKARDRDEILIASSEEEFARMIDDVLRNLETYKKIGTNARKFVEANFSWQKENKKLEEILLKEAKRNKDGL
jgi:sugar transferase (PEP-CTERM/EpsH1 system associated)